MTKIELLRLLRLLSAVDSILICNRKTLNVHDSIFDDLAIQAERLERAILNDNQDPTL